MFEMTVFITQSIIIVGILVYSYKTTNHLTKQLEKAQLAVMSRNMNEYLTATQTEARRDFTPNDPDEVLETDLSDDDFEKSIKTRQ